MIADCNRILTSEGFRAPLSLANSSFQLVCPQTGILQKAFIGRAQCEVPVFSWRVAPRQNTNGTATRTLFTTRPQFVPLVDSEFTYDLRIGDKIPAMIYDVGFDRKGYLYGFMYATGHTSVSSFDPGAFPLFKDQLEAIKLQVPHEGIVREFPGPDDAAAFKASFIKGYLAAKAKPKKFATASQSFLNFFMDNAGLGGFIITGEPTSHRKVNSSGIYDLLEVSYDTGLVTDYFRVIDGPNPCSATTEHYEVKVAHGGRYVVEGGFCLGSD